jgi:hypothetical protein
LEAEYSVETYRELENEFLKTALHRPMQIKRYEIGTELQYDLTGVAHANQATVRLVINKFVGGGFAGQVYRVKVLDLHSESGEIAGIEPGKLLAMKILIPPSFFSNLFRNVIYRIGFQGAFQLQVNPSAARSGAIWQKFIWRGAKARFGNENSVVDIYATFVDNRMGSCGELSEWIEGRTWRLEVDPHLDSLKQWRKGKEVDPDRLGSPEYRTKHEFMHSFVDLLHEIGAHEFARQYEWTTWKSQPNCLKRSQTEDSPTEGLVAVDFRAGLALLPFLPMSPGDFKLIWKGIKRGSLVQFDRGSIEKLEKFIAAHPEEFAGTETMLEDLKTSEKVYRDSVPDITHNHVRLLYSSGLWSTIFTSLVNGWKVRNLVSQPCKEKLLGNKALIILFSILGAIPLLGRFIRRIWGQPYWRKHYRGIITNPDYFRRAIRGKAIEKIIGWYRAGRIVDKRAKKLTGQIWRCLYHLPLSLLPVGLHRFLTDLQYAKERLDYIALRPIRLYFNAQLRTQWLHDMVEEGKKKHILTEDDSKIILSQVEEPFIQKYLKSLAVHICTLPVTQIVSVIIAAIYILTHPDMPRAESYAIGIGIIALFQVIPISPGSLVRGLYVLFLVIKERNFKDYNIAVFLGFFKYIGYLAFPIQMAYHYPAMARFMASHWATEAVHIVPVFGERGALLEHWIYSLFYNLPLTIRRKMNERSQMRATIKPRSWHIPLCALIGAGIFWLANSIYFKNFDQLSTLKEIWLLAIAIPFISGAAVTLFGGGTKMWKRVIAGTICGSAIAILQTILFVLLSYTGEMSAGAIAINCIWKIFVFAIISTIGVLLTELKLPGKKTR